MVASMRIISMIASATEIVCALGFEKNLVGRSHECDYPVSVKNLPVCTEPKFDVNGASVQIDSRVKTILQEGLSVYRVHVEKLRELKPDFVITQTQCEVCAVNEKDVLGALNEWLGAKPKLVSLAPNALADVWQDIERVAQALGAPERGAGLLKQLKARMAAVSGAAAKLAPKPRVACIEWIDPLMAAGNWIPELVDMAGGVNLFGEAGKHSPWMTWQDLQERDPDVVIVFPCGFDMEKICSEMPVLSRRPGWRDLCAVKNKRVYIADGNQYFNRPGPRLADSLEILAEILHPKKFPARYYGKAWQIYSA